MIKDFGKMHDKAITGIMISVDQKIFFISSFDEVLKQWNYEDSILVKTRVGYRMV